jgi:uncharacterized protein (TIGR02145 family)
MILLVICTLGCKKASFEHVLVNDKSKTFIIGEQIWMNQNLHVTRFNNGDFIPQAQSAKEWENAGKNKQPTWCYSKGDTSSILYNWYVIRDKRGIVPNGWHIPTFEEIQYLIKIQNTLNSLVSSNYDYARAYSSRTSHRKQIAELHTTYFIPLSYAGNRFGNGKFKGIEKIGVFWTSEEPEKGRGYIPVYAQLSDEKELYMVSSNPANGVAIRLLKNH